VKTEAQIALAVAAGGALGSLGRHWVSSWAALRFGDALPLGTLIANVSGCFFIGLLAGAFEGRPKHHPAWHFFAVGICGGYTTFSSFSAQTLELARGGGWAAAGLNVGASLLLCLVATAAGFAVARAIARG
jgi:CrcB protein